MKTTKYIYYDLYEIPIKIILKFDKKFTWEIASIVYFIY